MHVNTKFVPPRGACFPAPDLPVNSATFFFKHPVEVIIVRRGWAKSLEASSRKILINRGKSSAVMNARLMRAI